MLKKTTKRFNVRKAIFKLKLKSGGDLEVEIVGRLLKKRFLFWYKWTPEYVNPEKIVERWGQVGFIKISPRDFISIDKVDKISFRTKDLFLEKK